MRYSDFIEELKTYVAEAQRLRATGATHETPEFRRWRHGTEALVNEASAHGYRLPGEYNSSTRWYLDIHDSSLQGKQSALAKAISDSELELQFLVDQYAKYGEPPLASRTEGVRGNPESTPLTDVIRRHWLIGLSVWTVAVAGITWKVAEEISIGPKREDLQKLQGEIGQLRSALPVAAPAQERDPVQSMSIRVAEAETTRDGILNIRVASADESVVDFSIYAGTATTKLRVAAGGRGSITAEGRTYYIDVQRVRGNIVDMLVVARAP